MKNLYNFLFLCLISAFSTAVSAKNIADLSFQIPQQNFPASATNAYYPMELTGFNHDVIANGASQANTSTTTTIDFSNEFYSADFVPTTPYNGTSAAAVGGGLPANGQVSSAMTSGLTYQLADYSSNNALLIRPLTSNTGTLTFASPYTATSVYILWVATEAQANAVGITIHFLDGTTQIASNQIAYDWVGGNTNIALSGLSRVGSGSTQWAQLNEFSELGACKLFEKKIDILAANQAKGITGITFSYAPSGEYQSLVVFAVDVFGEPLSVESFERNRVLVYPNPSSDIVRVSSDIAVARISVLNTLGQEVKHADSAEISISELNSGTYFLKIAFENGQTSIKRLLKH